MVTTPAPAALLQPLLLLLNAKLTLQKNQFPLCGFSYALTATTPASAAPLQPLLLLRNVKMSLQKNQVLLFWLLLLSHGYYSRFCCSFIASWLLLLYDILTLQKNQFLLLRFLLLPQGHYSRFCCSLTASAAPPKCLTDLTKELIPPLAAYPTLSRPLPASAALSQPLLLPLNAKLTLQKNQPPLAASPTLSWPLLPLPLLSSSRCCSS
jgi:hypothetical protein